MRHQPIAPSLFIKNRHKLSGRLQPGSLAIIAANEPMPRNGDQFYPFRQNSDFFYLTGIEQSGCYLILHPGHPQEPDREVLFIPERNPALEKWEGRMLGPEEASALSGIKHIEEGSGFLNFLTMQMSVTNQVYLNLNEYPKFRTEVPYHDMRFAAKIKEMFPLHAYERLAPLLAQCRLIKEPEELMLIKKACSITSAAFSEVLKAMKPGMMEYEIEAVLTFEFLRSGAQGHSFAPIVASGGNTCILHYTSNSNQLKEGDLLLIDFGAEYANYAADCTRTIPIGGSFSPRQRECYEAVLRVQRELIPLYIPGNTIHGIHKKACELLSREMVHLGLLTEEDLKNGDEQNPPWARYYYHGTAHFLGLDVHDAGWKDTPFEKGMVLTCEPGIYIEEEGIGIRIETDILVDFTPVDLMAQCTVEADEIERLLAK